MQITANSVKLLTGGNVIKQGDETPLTFELFDETGNLVDLQGATVAVKIANQQVLVLEKAATINLDNSISIALTQDDITGNGVMRLEFHVTYSDLQKEIFPADGWQEIRITPSIGNLDNGNVAVVTVEKIKQEYQQQIDDFKGDVNLTLSNVDQQAAYAQAQGDYAKAEADRLVGTDVSVLDNKIGVLTELKTTEKGNLVGAVNEVSEQLAQSARQTQTLTHGLNVIESDQASPLKVEVVGNTLVNLLGKDGNCEDVSKWQQSASGGSIINDTSVFKYGSKSILMTYGTTGNQTFFKELKLEIGKYYVLVADVKTSTASKSRLRFGTNYSSYHSGNGNWQTLFVKFSPTDETNYIYAYNEGASSVNVDGFRLISIPQSTYDKIGVSLTDADVERMFPYVDSVQPIRNPVVKVEGENLLSPFSEWTLHANAKVISPYELETVATATGQQSYVDVICLPNKTYSFSGTGIYDVLAKNKDGTTLVSHISNGNSGNFTTPTGTTTLRIVADTTGTGTFKNSQPMLTLGSTAKPFVPRNPSYLYAETTLAGNSDKKDILSFNEDKRRWEKTKWYEVDKLIDGSLVWSFSLNYTGYKRVETTPPNNVSELANAHQITKYNGVPLKQYSNYSVDEFFLNKTYFRIIISNADTGWTDAMTPTADQIKAYFNGWKYTGDGTTHSWVSLVDGSAPATNTIDYVKANKAPNFTPYKLTYQLATSVIEPVTVEGSLAVNGQTQVEVGSGVIIREEVTPVYFTNSKQYRINQKDDSEDSWLNNRANKIMYVYKNGERDSKWLVYRSSLFANGMEHAYINEKDYDPSAEYTVTYELLDKHAFTSNLTEVKTAYANNIRSAVDDVVTKQVDIATDVSVHARSIIDLYVRVKALESGV